MIRNLPIREITTPAGPRYIYGPQTYRTLAAAQAAQAAHEAEYDSHIERYREDGEQAQAQVLADIVAETGLEPGAVTPKMREHHIQRRGYRNILAACAGDAHRAAELYRGG